MKTVIMAGGKGTRIRQIAQDIPKPLIPIEGKPVLERELECLRDQGFTDFILTLSHRSDQIRDSAFQKPSGSRPPRRKENG